MSIFEKATTIFRKRKSDGVTYPINVSSRSQRSQYTASLLQDLADNGRVMSELQGLSEQYNGLIARLGSVDDQSEQFFSQFQSALLSGINLATVNELARQNPSLAFRILQQMSVSDPGPNGQPQTYDVSKFKIYAPPSSSTPYSLSELNPNDKYLYPIQSLNIVPLTPYIFMSLTADDSMKFFVRSPEYPKVLFPVDILTLDGEENLIHNLLDPRTQGDILANLRMFNQIIEAADAAGGNPLPQSLVQGGNNGNNAGQQRPGVIIGGGQQVQTQVSTGQKNQNRQTQNTSPPPDVDQQDRTRREDRKNVPLILQAIPPVRPDDDVSTKDVLDFTLMFSPKYRKTVDFFRGWNAKPEIKDSALNQNLFSQIELFGLSKGLTPSEVVRPMETYINSDYATWNTKTYNPKEFGDFIAEGGAENTLKSLLTGFAQRYGIAGVLAVQNIQASPQNIWDAVSNNPQWLGYWKYLISHPREAKNFIALSVGGGGGNGPENFGVTFGEFRFVNNRRQNQGQYGGGAAYDNDNANTFNGANGFDIPGDDEGPRRAGGNPAFTDSGSQSADAGNEFIPPPILGAFSDQSGRENRQNEAQTVFRTNTGETVTREGDSPRTMTQSEADREFDRLIQLNKERTRLSSLSAEQGVSPNANIGVNLSKERARDEEAFAKTLKAFTDEDSFKREPDLSSAKPQEVNPAPTNGSESFSGQKGQKLLFQYAKTLQDQLPTIPPGYSGSAVSEMRPMTSHQILAVLDSVKTEIGDMFANNGEEEKLYNQDPDGYTYKAVKSFLTTGKFSTGNAALDKLLDQDQTYLKTSIDDAIFSQVADQ